MRRLTEITLYNSILATSAHEGGHFLLQVHHFKHSMAKAGKAWRPLALPHQTAETVAMEGECAVIVPTLRRILARLLLTAVGTFAQV